MEPVQKEGQLLKDINSEKHKLDVNNHIYEKGLCVSSNSIVIYSLNNKFKKFRSLVGHHADYPEYKGKVKFIVYLDEDKAYESGWLSYGETENISIPLKDVDKLTLELEDNGEPTSYVIWADAKLIEQVN